MKASIIILNWNGGALNCIEAVESALAQSWQNKEIIFVDNGSDDGSGKAVQDTFQDINYVQLPENIGCPDGRNKGAECARGELLFFLENDGVWDNSDLVSSAVSLFNKYETLGAAYTKVLGYASNEPDMPLDKMPSTNVKNGIYYSSSFRGGASVIRKKVFDDCGGFPSDYFRQGEERHLSLQIYELGYKVAYWPEHNLRHKGSDYQGKATMVYRYSIENTLKTIVRLYPLLPAFAIGVPKWLLGVLSLLRAGMFKDLMAVNYQLIKELMEKRKYKRISMESFCEVETIRQNKDVVFHYGSNVETLSMHKLLFRRLFLGR